MATTPNPQDQLKEIESTALERLEREATDLASLAAWERAYLGSGGEIAIVLRGMGQLPPELRPEVGRTANQVKQRLVAAYEERRSRLEAGSLVERLAAETLDVTLPGRAPNVG